MGLDLYPGAIWRRSVIGHDMRSMTLGIVMHWTVGREAGDITVLDGPRVDCQFYVTKDGDVYQFLDPDEQGWHAFFMANHYCIGIEHEGRGEPYTAVQLSESSRLVAYLCRRYGIPARHVDPSGHDIETFRGIFGHLDLSVGGERVDGNNHTDTVPGGTGWGDYFAAVRKALGQGIVEKPRDLSDLPGGGTLRLVVHGRKWAGWEDCEGPMRWIDREALAMDTPVSLAWQGNVWRNPAKVVQVVRTLVGRYLD